MLRLHENSPVPSFPAAAAAGDGTQVPTLVSQVLQNQVLTIAPGFVFEAGPHVTPAALEFTL